MKLLTSICGLFATVPLAVANPVITEFMADNSATIQDEDGSYSDWIEVHNPTGSPLNLDQWALTDDAQSLTKWRFPAVTIAPGDFLIVWASGKNRRTPGLPLHTNFSLSKDGEYLALVRPDGEVLQDFGPKFPPQEANESYGLQFSSTKLLSQGNTVKYRVPTDSSLGTSWIAPGFNDSAWSSGTTGVGFGLLLPGINVREVKKNTAYGTLNFLADVDALLALPAGSAQIQSETTKVCGTVNFLGEGGDAHYANNLTFPNGGGDDFCIKATGYIDIPAAGAWTFGLNTDDGGRIRIDGANVMVDDTQHGPGDHFGVVNLTAGIHSFEVVMWERGGGDEAEFFARQGNFGSWTTEMKLVGDTANGGLAAYTVPAGSGGAIGTNIQGVMQNVNATCYMRIPFNASGSSGYTALSLRMRYNDGYVAYLNGTAIGSKNAPASPAYNSAATAARTTTQSLVPESVNISQYLPQLVTGTNVLAIHGMNNVSGDGAFLELPEIVAGSLNAAAEPVFYGNSLATPGSINGSYSVIGKVSDTQFSVDRGFYTTPITVAITTTTPGATIRYTTNNSSPSETNGTVYSGPLTISSTTVLRARAFKTGYEPTDIDTQTYIFVNDVISQAPTGAAPPGWPTSSGTGQVLDYGMDPDIVNNVNSAIGGQTQVKNALVSLPSVSLTTDMSNLFDINGSQGIYSHAGSRGFAWERPCSMEWINPPDGSHPNGTSEFQVNCGVRIRGGFSRQDANPKHAFHMFFRAEYGDSKLRYPLFGAHGVDEFDQIDLRCSQNYAWSLDGGSGGSNNTFLREESTRLALRDMGQPYGRLRYFHLYLNGQYWGLFNTEERTEASFAESYFGGKKSDYDVVKCEQASGYITGVTDGDLNAWQELWTKSKAHLASPTNTNYFKMQGLAADGVTPTADPVLLDVNNLIDYLLLTIWTGNDDGCTSGFLGNDKGNNWFAIRNRTGTKGGFVYMVHDFEHSFGLGSQGGPMLNYDRTGPYTANANYAGFTYSNPMFIHQDLLANAEYRIRWADRIYKHMFNDGALTASSWTNRFNSIIPFVDASIIAESARWGDAKRASPFTKNDWLNAKNYLLGTFVPSRGAIVLSQLRTDGLYPSFNPPTIGPAGGYVPNNTQVILGATSGNTYYMPDGSDPRAIGGSVRPGAIQYSGGSVGDVIVPLGSTWKYLENGSNQGVAWRSSGFNDSTWLNGKAEIGHGDGDETTLLRTDIDVNPSVGGIQKPATVYFRKTITIPSMADVVGASVTVKYDDAAIVYVNGQQVAITSGISSNPSYDTYASSSIEPDATTTYPFAASVLAAGSNTIAVEVHRSSSNDSDLSFDLRLDLTRSSTATPLVLTGGGVHQIRVRALNGNEWSALAEATFLVDTEPASASNLVISEIMYHPADPSPDEIEAGFTDSEDFEYIELTNIGTKHVDLEGLYLYGAINFSFTGAATGRTLAPGGRVLVVAKRPAFEKRYGAGKPVAGAYKGSLNNSGETINLYFANDSILRSVTYSDLEPWPTGADGGGYSLVLKKPGTNPDDSLATNWRLSSSVGGGPGDVDSFTLDLWRAATGAGADLDDEDGDGLNNFSEYALGGNPKVNSQAQYPRTGPGDFVTLTFTRPVNVDDVLYEVEGAAEPGGPFLPSGAVFVSEVSNGDGTTTSVYRASEPVSGTKRQFLRLKLTHAP